jgi:hypothetical protein
MTISSSQLRRDFTQLAIRSAIAATARLPIEHQRRTVRSLIAFAGEIPALRRKVRRNMSMALGADVPPHAERLYFSRVGWFLANALAVFHHGAKASAVFDEIKLDESIGVLDAAVAEGRGAVIVSHTGAAMSWSPRKSIEDTQWPCWCGEHRAPRGWRES